MLAWMRSFGDLQRIGIESTGSYGAGLLRYTQTVGIESWKSPLQTDMTVASAARLMIWMRKAPHMQPSQATELSPREAETVW